MLPLALLSILGTVGLFAGAVSAFREKAFGMGSLAAALAIVLAGLNVFIITSIFTVPNSETRQALVEFNAALESCRRAYQLANRQAPFSRMPEEDWQQTTQHFKSALAHAQKVDASALEEIYPGWGEHFRDELREGLQLVVQGNEKGDLWTSLAGQMSMARWNDWYDAHVDEIRNEM